VATAPRPIVPLTQAEFDAAVATNHRVTEPVTIRFSTPMDRRSVAATLHVEPATAVVLTWAADDTILTVSPMSHWAAGVFHTVTVEAGALGRSGQPLTRPARAIFLTRAATRRVDRRDRRGQGSRAHGTSFVVSFARPVEASTVAAAIRLDPPVAGSIEAIGCRVTTRRPVPLRFVPDAPLRPDVAYRLIVDRRRGRGRPSLPTAELVVQTAWRRGGPFRPRRPRDQVARDATITTRFTAKMDRGTTARALTVKVAGKTIAGAVGWAENEHGRLFTPKAALPANATVSVDVAGSATDAAGIPLAAAVHVAFKTATGGRESRHHQATGSVPISSGGAVGGGSWGQGRDVLPGAHELHADRRLGDVDGRCSSPAAATSRRSSWMPGSARRSAGRMRNGSPSEGIAATSSVATPATGCGAPATRAIAGRRTWAAAPATPTRPSWARTSSSRARSRTTVATT
jgi:hypothetical protein